MPEYNQQPQVKRYAEQRIQDRHSGHVIARVQVAAQAEHAHRRQQVLSWGADWRSLALRCAARSHGNLAAAQEQLIGVPKPVPGQRRAHGRRDEASQEQTAVTR
jgi:hypothetical protein